MARQSGPNFFVHFPSFALLPGDKSILSKNVCAPLCSGHSAVRRACVLLTVVFVKAASPSSRGGEDGNQLLSQNGGRAGCVVGRDVKARGGVTRRLSGRSCRVCGCDAPYALIFLAERATFGSIWHSGGRCGGHLWWPFFSVIPPTPFNLTVNTLSPLVLEGIGTVHYSTS